MPKDIIGTNKVFSSKDCDGDEIFYVLSPEFVRKYKKKLEQLAVKTKSLGLCSKERFDPVTDIIRTDVVENEWEFLNCDFVDNNL